MNILLHVSVSLKFVSAIGQDPAKNDKIAPRIKV